MAVSLSLSITRKSWVKYKDLQTIQKLTLIKIIFLRINRCPLQILIIIVIIVTINQIQKIVIIGKKHHLMILQEIVKTIKNLQLLKNLIYYTNPFKTILLSIIRIILQFKLIMELVKKQNKKINYSFKRFQVFLHQTLLIRSWKLLPKLISDHRELKIAKNRIKKIQIITMQIKKSSIICSLSHLDK